MKRHKTYAGIHNEAAGGMTPTGNIVLDAWVFRIIPESETCGGWSIDRIDALYDEVTKAWEPHGHLASRLPERLRRRHERIYRQGRQCCAREGLEPRTGRERGQLSIALAYSDDSEAHKITRKRGLMQLKKAQCATMR